MSLSLTTFRTPNARVDVTYKLTGQPETVPLSDVVVRPGVPFNNGTIIITTNALPHSVNGIVLAIDIKALKEIELVHFEAKYSVDLTDQRMLANGFQSWSQAREMNKADKIPSIRSSIAWYTQYNLQGDYDFFPHSGEKGHIHSSSYTHFRDVHNILHFFGSISESLGYTYFRSDYNNNVFSVYKDVFGKTIAANQTLELIRIFIGESDQEGALWDMYAGFFEDKRCLKGNTAQRHVNGWTSWYNYYGDVSEEIVLENVEALVKYKYPINVFQIDDGFQTAIGDWLSINKKFPSGMKSVATKIKSAGFMAGLWLAPYAVGFNSDIAKKHQDWLIQDPVTKKPVVAGPNWGGFYALDMYHPQAREYLREVFHVVLEDWGFDMVKLDFLFAAAMIPRLGKSRGEIMWDAMEQIRELVGPDKLILGCGVPLAAAWRKVDYCRIGSDVSPWWEGKLVGIIWLSTE
ncbi:glycoside hydrolase superfamily [Phycomyces nitens]|nr:glycoside hydrolase superfamily [Phycomyces nitens]